MARRQGVKFRPPWCRLPYLDWARDMLLDYMHTVKNCGHRIRSLFAGTYSAEKDYNSIQEISPTPNMEEVSLANYW